MKELERDAVRSRSAEQRHCTGTALVDGDRTLRPASVYRYLGLNSRYEAIHAVASRQT